MVVFENELGEQFYRKSDCAIYWARYYIHNAQITFGLNDNFSSINSAGWVGKKTTDMLETPVCKSKASAMIILAQYIEDSEYV